MGVGDITIEAVHHAANSQEVAGRLHRPVSPKLRVAGDCGRKFRGKMEWSQYVGRKDVRDRSGPVIKGGVRLRKHWLLSKWQVTLQARVAKCDYKLLFMTLSRAIRRRKDDGSSRKGLITWVASLNCKKLPDTRQRCKHGRRTCAL